MNLKNRFNLWLNAIKNPKQTFATEKLNATFASGAVNMLLAGLIVGLINGIAVMYTNNGLLGFSGWLIGGPITAFMGWVVWGGIVYIFAKLFGGSGTYTTQLYLMSLYLPLITILSSLLGHIPTAGGILVLVLWIYRFYLLTLALKEAHVVDTGKAILSWIIPLLVLLAVLVVLAVVLVSIFGAILLPLLGTGA